MASRRRHATGELEHYSAADKVEALMALGDLSSLAKEIGEKHDFDSRAHRDWCCAYGRDCGETDIEAVESKSLEELSKLTRECGGEFLYLFRDGAWFIAEGGIAFFGMPASKEPGALRPLADVLKEQEAEQD